MPKIITFANQKGGVGKTTSCINLCASLVTVKKRLLLVDMDPQGNATMGVGINKHDLAHSVYDVLLGNVSATDATVRTPQAGFDVIPANQDLTAAEIQMIDMPQREQQLKKALETVSSQYDYILIDCPPSLGLLSLNALVASDSVIIPMQCEYYALEGLSGLVRTIQQVQKTLNRKLKIEGILRTMYDARNRLSVEVGRQLIQHFGDTVYRTVIPRNVRLAEAPSHGLPAVVYDRYSRGAVAYLALAGELIKRQEKQTAEAVA